MFYAKYNVKASKEHSHKTLLTADFVEKITNSIPYKKRIWSPVLHIYLECNSRL